MLRYLPYMLVIALWIYAFVDCAGTPPREVRGLPKVVWLLIILLFGEILIGPLAWMAIGKRREPMLYAVPPRPAHGKVAQAGPEPRPEPGEWIAPDDNPEFLRSLSELNRQQRGDGTPPSDGE
jgi:Phospholipase_D-nuclease N-terminal